MSDKLEWLNKHFVAIKYTKINDTDNLTRAEFLLYLQIN